MSSVAVRKLVHSRSLSDSIVKVDKVQDSVVSDAERDHSERRTSLHYGERCNEC
jgi:hypothetical protein